MRLKLRQNRTLRYSRPEPARGLGRRASLLLAAGGDEAFSLAEIMVTVFLLAVATLSLYAGFASGYMLVDSTRNELRATQILTQKAEALRLCSWSSLTNFPISFTEQYDSTNNGISTTAAGTIFVGTVSTNTPSAIPNTCAYKANMCMATVTLFWTNVYGKQVVVHSRSLQTMMSRYGIQNYIWGNGS